MNPIKALIRLTGVFLLLLGATQHNGHQASASEPKMDYWFIETLKAGGLELPAGVDILASDPSLQPRGFFVLENKTEIPLYVMSLSYKAVLVMTTPDPNWKSRVNGAHEAASFIAVPGRSAYLDMAALTDLDQNLVDRNVLSSAPPPDNQSIPAVQSSELLLVYADQVIEVPFTLTYSLNTHFDSGSLSSTQPGLNVQATGIAGSTSTQQAEALAEREARETFLVVGLVGITILAVSGWLVWRSLNRSR